MGGYGAQYGSPQYGYEILGIAPILMNQSPAPGTTDISRSSNIVFELFDEITGVDTDSVVVYIDGAKAWEDDAPVGAFAGVRTDVLNGYRYEINPDDLLANFSWIVVEVQALSIGGGVLEEDYQFQTRDEVGPILENRNPRDGERYVERERPIIFDVTDGNNVNEDSIEIYVDGILAWENNASKPGFTITKTVIANGFNFNIDPASDFAYEDSVSVRVVSTDIAPTPSTSDHTYNFTTISTLPVVTVQTPSPSGDAGTDTHIIIGLEHKYGIRLDSIKVWIQPSSDESFEIAFDGSKSSQFTSKYEGPHSEVIPTGKGYKIIIDRVSNFEVGKTVTAHVHAAAAD